ncbi:sulfatase atsG, partial [Planctomycetota bacterium]
VLPTYIEAAGGTPPPVLDGKSLLPVLKGETTEHKKYVFGEMTTRGINNGSDYFGIRSIRSAKFKYVWNFTPEIPFQNACTSSSIFKSWRQKAETDSDAADKIHRYEHRPAEELYDITKDPYEWNNLADEPKYATVKVRMRRRLDNWMKAMGDKGQQTELEAIERQNRNRNKKSKNSPQKRQKKQKKTAQTR